MATPQDAQWTFGDALAGAGGTADPLEPTLLMDSSTADVFQDALAALPLPALTLSVSGLRLDGPAAGSLDAASGGASVYANMAGASGPPGAVTVAARRPPPVAGRAGQVRRPVASVLAAPLQPWSTLAPPGQFMPAPYAQPPVAAGPARPLPAGSARRTGPPAAIPAATAPVSAVGRRPVPGFGYAPGPPAGPPNPIPPTRAVTRRPTVGSSAPVRRAPADLLRPPAYLPQVKGMAQFRTAVEQARRSAGRASRPAAAVRKGKRSGPFGFLVVLVVFLITSGAGEKVVDAISQLLHSR